MFGGIDGREGATYNETTIKGGGQVIDENGREVGGYGLLSRYRGELMGIAMLYVMLFHAYELNDTFLPFKAFRSMGFAGVDIFLVLSGMGICCSLARREQESYGRYLGRRLRRLLPAFWLVVGIYSVALAAAGRITPDVIFWNLSTLSYWLNVPEGFNWYISAILAFYLAAPFYFKLFRRCAHKEWLTLFIYLISYLLYRVTWGAGLLYLPDFLLRIPDFAMGFLVGSYVMEGKKLNARHLAVWVTSAVLALAVVAGWLVQPVIFPLILAVVVGVMPVCLLLGRVLHWYPGRWVPAFLRLVGGSSLEIYLLNVVITREFDLLAPWLDHDPRHIGFYLIAYTFNIALGVLLHRVLERLMRRFAS